MSKSIDVGATIAEIWRQVLKTPSVDPTDNFLDLGGNSLRAGEMASKIRDALAIEMPIDVVLSEETFARLVEVATGMVQEQVASAGVAPEAP